MEELVSKAIELIKQGCSDSRALSAKLGVPEHEVEIEIIPHLTKDFRVSEIHEYTFHELRVCFDNRGFPPRPPHPNYIYSFKRRE